MPTKLETWAMACKGRLTPLLFQHGADTYDASSNKTLDGHWDAQGSRTCGLPALLTCTLKQILRFHGPLLCQD